MAISPILSPIVRPHSMIAEQYRALRTSLEFSSVSGELKVISIVSSVASVGKSVTAANLSLVMAQAGRNTLLIDADLRRPSIARLFGIRSTTGLTNAITHPDAWESHLVPGPMNNLSILTSGPIPPNPAEMVSSPLMRSLLNHFRERFDTIIIDTPPLLAFTDGVVLSQASDGVLLVIRSGFKSRKLDVQAKQRLQQVDARIIGAVLNAVRLEGEMNDYYYYEYGDDK